MNNEYKNITVFRIIIVILLDKGAQVKSIGKALPLFYNIPNGIKYNTVLLVVLREGLIDRDQ